MDFGLSEEQTLLQDTIRRFLDSQCPTTRVRQIMESASGHDADLWQGLADMGITGLAVPAEHGGAGLELLDAALAAESLGWCCAPGPFLGSTMAAIALTASEDVGTQSIWLPRIVTGEAVVTFALGEGLGEWDAARLTTTARDGKLSGEKPLVPYGDVADAIVVAAQDDDGPGMWLVERDAPGMTHTTLKVFDMTRRVSMVGFDKTPAKKIAGGRGPIDRTRDAGLILVAADAFGGAARCLDMTAKYALTREQFGQPIGAFQGVKHQLADLACDLEPSRSLWWYAAHAYDQIIEQSERHAAITKAHMTDLYDRVTRYAIELHGGIGFTWEFDLHLWWRRALFDRAFLGEASYHRERAARLAGWVAA
jgi:alkylation response protein AidB-like acyl-CoA dehydrogenase